MEMVMDPRGCSSPLEAALRIIEDAWNEQRRSPYVRQQLSDESISLPDLSFEESDRRSRVGRDILARLDKLDVSSLSVDINLTLRLVAFRARTWSRESEWYWTVIDPLGVGFFGIFLPTAYCGGLVMNMVLAQLSSLQLRHGSDRERCLHFLKGFGQMVDQINCRTIGQAKRGIYIPKVQVHGARSILSGCKTSLRAAVSVALRSADIGVSSDFATAIEKHIVSFVDPAFSRAMEIFSDAYLYDSPDSVGLGQYKDGEAIYSELVRINTTLNLTPAEVHERGIHRIQSIEASMQRIRRELGYLGDKSAFIELLEQDPRWRANTVDEVTATFDRYIDRLDRCFNKYFPSAPKASFCVAPLPSSLEDSMTYGYYDAPRSDSRSGKYLFNVKNLTSRSLFAIGSLTYHELMPGHHLHIASQQENENLHPFRKYSFVNAFNEGWAEYAATFAGEIGLYEEPEEKYGRLLSDALLTCRLVVDTGMNVMGWSLQKAREYLREHSGMTEKEIVSESLRYSCDIPAQSLAYKLGDIHILALRRRMQDALKERFDVKEFHRAVLAAGSLPMPELTWHIDQEIQRIKSGVQ